MNADEYLYEKTLSADTDSDTLKDHKLKFPTSGHFWEGYINYQQVSAFVKKLLEAKKEGIYGSFAPDQNAVTYDRSDRSNPHMALAVDRTDLNSTLKNEKAL